MANHPSYRGELITKENDIKKFFNIFFIILASLVVFSLIFSACPKDSFTGTGSNTPAGSGSELATSPTMLPLGPSQQQVTKTINGLSFGDSGYTDFGDWYAEASSP